MCNFFYVTRRLVLILILTLVGLTSCSDESQATEDDAATPIAQPSPTEPAPTPDQGFPGYDLTWTETLQSPIALYESQGLAADGLLYVFGGYYNEAIKATTSAYAFDPQQQRWHSLAPMPEAVTHAGQASYQGKIYLAGGFVGDHPGPPTNHVWIYDIRQDTWSPGPKLPAKLGGGALVELNERLHFFGGTLRRGFEYLRDSSKHWVLDLGSQNARWVEAAPLPNPRNHIAGVAVAGKVYAIGGQHLGDEESGNQDYVDAYDPASDSWERVASLPEPLGHISAATFAYGGRIVVVMGVTQGRTKLTDIIAYDPESNTWDDLTPMPGARSATVAGVIGGKIVLATGNVAGGPLDTTWIGTWGGNGQ